MDLDDDDPNVKTNTHSTIPPEESDANSTCTQFPSRSMNGAYTGIIYYQFSSVDGYFTENEYQQGRYLELRTVHWLDTPPRQESMRLPFLVTHCYNVRDEHSDGMWSRACEMLRLKLCGFHRTTAFANRSYEILYVGRYVRHFEFDRETQALVSLGGERPYHIGNDCETVQGILDGIRDNHILF